MKQAAKKIFSQLKKAGTAQNRKIYARHGVNGEMFGVSYAELKRLKKEIGTDHETAVELWDTGNHDARVLATMIADPDLATVKLINSWVIDLNNVLTDSVAKFVSRTKHADKKMNQWIKSKQEFVSVCGWILLALKAMDEVVPDSYFEPYLKTIEQTLQSAQNQSRHSMNMALISIGIRNAKMEQKAIKIARKIGKVEVDHGQTSCKTPDAVSYIKKARARAK